MNQGTIQTFFSLLRSAISGRKLTKEEKSLYSEEQLGVLFNLAKKHDLAHLLVFALKQNCLLTKEHFNIEKVIFEAVSRYERISYEYEQLCSALERARIPFMPLKGSVIRKWYPEPWMRTSCDIDVLVHREHLESAISYLKQNLAYIEEERGTHDVALFSSSNIHVELHFDLVEEGRANNAINILRTAWDSATLRAGTEFCYEMSDDVFYFYHIAHMAKHFEGGGCGIRPFIDLWILDKIKDADQSKRDYLLEQGGLKRFAFVSKKLSRIWFGDEKEDSTSIDMQNFIIQGGVYGSADNRVALQQKKKGGRLGYFLSRIFIPYSRLKRYYPVLEKHRWLMPFMQVRRWFMLLNPNVAKMAKAELSTNKNLDKTKADKMNKFLEEIGL